MFVQTERPTGRRQSEDEDQSAVAAEPSPVLAATTTAVDRQRPLSGRRQQRTRSEVYARTFPREIRKMGILAAGIVVALTIFTIVL